MSRARTLARRLAVQALYQWQVTNQDLGDIENQFLVKEDAVKAEVAWFSKLLHQVPKHLDTLDAAMATYLDRAIESVDPVERAILRLGAYELLYHPEIPFKVVINEAVELAKLFGAEKGHKYVNGILDKVAQDSRKIELGKN